MKYKDFKTMSQNEMKEIKGGTAPEDGDGRNTCGTVCTNCLVLSIRNCGPTCVGTSSGVTCQNGVFHPCPTSGNYCS